MEYTEKEIEILQRILDYYRDIPEAPLVGMSIRFDEDYAEACKSLEQKGIAKISHFKDDPPGSTCIGVNKAGADEIARLFKAGILKKFEDRIIAKTE